MFKKHPVQTLYAEVDDKFRHGSRYGNYYYVFFSVRDFGKAELEVDHATYSSVNAGETGTLTFQRKKCIRFAHEHQPQSTQARVASKGPKFNPNTGNVRLIVSFELPDPLYAYDRPLETLELRIGAHQYDKLRVGDHGTLTYRGAAFVQLERINKRRLRDYLNF